MKIKKKIEKVRNKKKKTLKKEVAVKFQKKNMFSGGK